MEGTLNQSLGIISLVDTIYPVGIRIKFENDTNPNECWPWQTWEQITDGLIEVSAGGEYALGDTGGEAEHALTIDETPAHRHTMIRPKWYSVDADVQNNSSNAIFGSTITVAAYYSTERDMETTGGDQPHNNMPPYVAVNTWVRTA